MYYVYMLRCMDNSIYTGITNQMKKRYMCHTSKLPSAAKYTKSREVIGVEAIWGASDKSHALRLEYRIKRLTKPKKEQLIKNPQNLPEGIDRADYIYMGNSIEKSVIGNL